MIMCRIALANPMGGDEPLYLELSLHPSYGATPELAHELVTLCLTAAERPVVIRSDGEIMSIPRALVRAVVTTHR
jgi:hypothetical protein